MTDFTSNISLPTWNSGGNACFLEKLKDIMKVFFWFRTKLFLVVSSSKRESSCCKTFSSCLIIICVLSQNLSGKLRFWLSGVSDFLRLIVAAFVASSTNFNWIALLPDRGRGMGGLIHIPLNLMMNKNPPSQVPAPYPPGKLLSVDLAC